ncbi:hypothetical protein [Polaromonas sp.]|uniref:hypothetical protein n=1 Tax=Polaromonas sp. TaxID=1869339 RepID=UPI00352B10C9
MDDHIQISSCGRTLWVHGTDGSTVGRFSTIFGMDVHTTFQQQMDGANQCLHCTHQQPTRADWIEFCRLMSVHHQISVDDQLMYPETETLGETDAEPVLFTP